MVFSVGYLTCMHSTGFFKKKATPEIGVAFLEKNCAILFFPRKFQNALGGNFAQPKAFIAVHAPVNTQRYP